MPVAFMVSPWCEAPLLGLLKSKQRMQEDSALHAIPPLSGTVALFPVIHPLKAAADEFLVLLRQLAAGNSC